MKPTIISSLLDAGSTAGTGKEMNFKYTITLRDDEDKLHA
jgi:hypothetical protein